MGSFSSSTILAADIGGTKTRVALFDGERCLREEKYASRDHASFSEILTLFLQSEVVENACFAIAGPVKEGRCHATNLPWGVDAAEVAREFKISRVDLINDLEATAWSLSTLSPEDLLVLNQGLSVNGNRAIIAAGTGLGEAGLYWNSRAHEPLASEGGHVDFAPRNELEMELLRYLRLKFDHVSYERILSGAGLTHLYRFLIEMRLEKVPSWEQKGFPEVITEKAVKNECHVCVRVVEWFVSIYGSEAGNLALKFLATGGVYLAGGIAPHIVPFLKSRAFMQAFTHKGRFKDLLSGIPVVAVLNERAPLLGAKAKNLNHK